MASHSASRPPSPASSSAAPASTSLDRLTHRFPVLTAASIYSALIALVFSPFFAGRFLINPTSDQRTGYAFREFAAWYLRAYGDVPQWSPYLYGGMPFAANTAHGDMFYPTFLLRLVLPVDIGMSLGFLIHFVLAGVFAFMLLRALRLSWGAAFVGGTAYMLSGQLVSLVSPGHDGKLFVSALLPLALMFLYQATSSGTWRKYVYFGVVVGFELISPHFQMTYYLLMACGFFWLFMVVWSGERPDGARIPLHALLFIGALAVGFALAAVQLLPFSEYIAFSPRGAGGPSAGYEYATGFSMPPEEILNIVWANFSGLLDNYWGRAFFKLHSEYVGVTVLMLATLAFALPARRRMSWFFVFLALYGAFFAFGGYTPLYRIPYAILPGISKTRAPNMIFFLVSLSASMLAAFGTQALIDRMVVAPGKGALATLRGAGGVPRALLIWLAVLAAALLLAVVGGWTGVMQAMADPAKMDALDRNVGVFTVDTLRVLVMGAALAGLVAAGARWRWSAPAWCLAVALLVTLDLWSAERPLIRWSAPAAETFAADSVVKTLQADRSLFRVLPLNVYSDNYLMSHRQRSVLGYNGQEINRYDELLGGKGVFGNLLDPQRYHNLWRLLAVKYVAADQPFQLPNLAPTAAGPLRTYDGRSAYLFRFTDADPYAYVVPAAVRVADNQIIPTLLDPRFDPRRIMLLPEDAPAGVTALQALPEPVQGDVRITERRPGSLSVELATPAPKPAFLFVSENWYPAWTAHVDGRPAAVLRAQYTFLGVALPAGARRVDLVFREQSVTTGRLVSIVTLVVVLGIALSGWFSNRRPGADA